MSNTFSKVILAVGFSILGLMSSVAKAEIQTVPYVDVAQYLGDWYQIAHIPLIFEGGNCACARQRLTPSSSAGVINVFNSCNTGDASGALRTITGTASDDDKNTNAKFTVSFEGVPFKGSYWIIGIDSMYRYAVVSDKGGDALYILSKTPTLDKNLYDEAVAIGAKQVDISSLAVTDQTNCTYPK
jgi:apolipoprotein D and lipocalin family protein